MTKDERDPYDLELESMRSVELESLRAENAKLKAEVQRLRDRIDLTMGTTPARGDWVNNTPSPTRNKQCQY